jgi:hypothetical protein
LTRRLQRVETNPYAPPKAAVADVEAPSAAATAVFFPVSKTKLIVMSTATFTLYQLLWFYKNWAAVRARGAEVLPLMRTIFTVFFCYDLFDRIRRHRRDAPSTGLAAGWLALGWVVVTIAGNVLDWNGASLGDPSVVFLVSLVVSYASVGFLLPVQTAVDAINRQEVPEHDPNDRFTVWNWLWIVCGGLVTVAAVLGTAVAPA